MQFAGSIWWILPSMLLYLTTRAISFHNGRYPLSIDEIGIYKAATKILFSSLLSFVLKEKWENTKPVNLCTSTYLQSHDYNGTHSQLRPLQPLIPSVSFFFKTLGNLDTATASISQRM
uniref:AlNc14C1007G12708 protein n=1 Tax=Albugo laibachii Nc14 TaxID=890382 RepID=F0X2E7_9STRA|nr:AlNc14C1007G12708 [Albugo laibachii Nc14]|eukprot:CCA28037.1 AlNc14C1007G12708 [Albugo laibachii Nc14]